MVAIAAAGAGFLLAVVWFDLMFDVQVFGHDEPDLPEEVLASIAAYYRRVTTTSRPMSRLIVLVMLATLGAIVAELVDSGTPNWVAWTSLALASIPIALAGGRTVPSAVRLGARDDSITDQSTLARSICREHLLCLAAIGGLLALQLAAA